MAKLPSYRTLILNYPTNHALPGKQLLDSIGGQVRAQLDDSVNTCAIRMSSALNASGQNITHTPGLHLLKGAAPPKTPRTPRAAPADLCILRVKDIKKYLEKHYGAGKLIYDALKQPKALVNLKTSTQGIIVFVWSGPYGDFGAFGHVDLFRLWPNEGKPPRLEPACAGECFWWTAGGPMAAFLWETEP